MSDVIIGIDLGTTNSLVAVMDAAGPRVITGDQNQPLVPSVVRFEPGHSRVVVGRQASDHAADFPTTTFASVKRLLGRSIKDTAGEQAFFPYQIIAGENDTIRLVVPGEGGDRRLVSPEEVSAHVLSLLREHASNALGQNISKAVVTVPAYFDDAQRQATRTAARLAGLDVVRIVNEPTAAALAYGLGVQESQPRTVAVFDLGGGTFDISILRIIPPEGSEETSFFQVLSTAGDTRLGGDDADNLLITLLAGEMIPGGDIASLPPGTRRALKQFAQSVKHRLSQEDSAQVRIQLDTGRDYERTITRAEFEALITPMADRAIEACKRAMRDAAPRTGGKVDAVIMVGGSTRIPLIRARAREFFRVEPYTAIDPDLAVGLGAAVQAGLLSGAAKDALLLDVIPLSLGIETVGGAVAKLIVRNSGVPARATEMFSTSTDGQTSIKLNVLQGEREMAKDCRSLGEFHLRGIPPMPAGIPQLEVEFLVDASGVLSVTAHERRSGRRAALQVVPNHGISPDEVARIEHESFQHAREDMAQHRVVDLTVNAKLDLKWITERFTRYADKLDPEYRRKLEEKIEALQALVARAQAAWQSVDPAEFQRAKESLDRASVRLQEIGISESLKES